MISQLNCLIIVCKNLICPGQEGEFAVNLKQALYVKTIAEEGSVSAAAKKLYISQPSLSQMLRLVEAEVGVALFERSPFRPTYAGERYLHAATVMLNTNEILSNELQEIRQEGSGRLRLGISRQRAAQVLPVVLPRFSKAYPHVVVELREAGSATLEQMVQEGEVDLALAATSPSLPDLEYRLIQRETIGILAGKDSPLVTQVPSGVSIGLEAVGEGPFVSLKPGHNIRIIQDLIFREHNIIPSIYLETDNMETALQVTRTSACYMLCPNVYTTPGNCFYPLAGHENLRHFYACLRQGQTVPRFMNHFLELVRECVASAIK